MTTLPTRHRTTPPCLWTFKVANYFLTLAWSQDVHPCQQKLQRLVYYAHGWHLALSISNVSLLGEPVRALHYGPVLQSLQDEFVAFGNDPVTRLARTFWEPGPGLLDYSLGSTLATPQIPQDHASQRDILFEVWQVYGGFTGVQLSNMAHSEGTPWHRLYQAYGEHLPADAVIPTKWVQEHFARLKTMTKPRKVIP